MTRTPFIALAPFIVLLAACDTTEPAPGLDVALRVDSVSAPVVETDASGVPSLSCIFYLTAEPTGSSGVFTTAKAEWFWGSTRQAVNDVLEVDSATVAAIWSSDSVRSGERPSATLEVGGPFPFDVAMEFRIRESSGRIARASFRERCGPAPSSSPAPTIQALTLSTPSRPLAAGDTLILSYQAASAAGLWTAKLQVRGAFEMDSVISDAMQLLAGRVVRFVIPQSATIGQPVSASLVVSDVFQKADTAMQQSPPLADGQRPTLTIRFTNRVVPPGDSLVGPFFVGEQIMMQPLALDNHALGHLVWMASPSGTRDSVPLSGTLLAGVTLPVPVRQEWLGSAEQLRFFVRDAGGLSSDTVVTRFGALRVLATGAPGTLLQVGGPVLDVVTDSARNRLYVMQADPYRIAIVTLVTRTVVQTIPLSTQAFGGDLSVSGDSLLVALPLPRSIGVIDLKQSSPTMSTIALTGLDASTNQYPTTILVAANGKAYIGLAGSAPSAHRVLELNLATGAQQIRPELSLPATTGSLFRSPDREVFFFGNSGVGSACVRRYVIDTGDHATCKSLSGGVGPLGISRDGSRVVSSINVYDETLTFLRQVESVTNMSGAATISVVDPFGSTLYHFLSYGIIASSVSTGALLTRHPLPNQEFLDRMLITDDGKFIVGLTRKTTASAALLIFAVN